MAIGPVTQLRNSNWMRVLCFIYLILNHSYLLKLKIKREKPLQKMKLCREHMIILGGSLNHLFNHQSAHIYHSKDTTKGAT
jgi:hypothetical protein